MPERKEHDQQPSESRESIIARAFGISPNMLDELQVIAKLVAEDWAMKVELGEPGTGSFFDGALNRIQFDPLDIAKPHGIDRARFVAAHEGGHRAITRSPEALGVSKALEDELYAQLGFAFGANALEDPADNDWWAKKYEGLGDTVRGAYDQMFQQDGAVLGTPETRKITAQLGYVPNFVSFGSEVIRYWHTGTFSSGLAEPVRDALDQAKTHIDAYISHIPSEHPREKEIIEAARDRFRIYVEQIWPIMESIKEDDLKNQAVSQALQEGKVSVPQELDASLKKALQEAVERMAQSIEQQGKEQAQAKEKQAKALRSAAKKAKGTGKNGKDTPMDPGEQALADSLQKKADELKEQAKDIRKQSRDEAKMARAGKGENPVPMNALPRELLDALEKAFRALPKSDQDRLKKNGVEKLTALEDALNKELQSKLDPRAPKDHQARRADERKKQVANLRHQQEEEERALATEEIRRALEQERTPYDVAYAEMLPHIERFVERLDRILPPNGQLRWKGSHASGTRLDMQKVMQYEARPELYDQLWEKKMVPHVRDFTFTLLIDLSGSMTQNGKIQATFKGAVLIAESLARLGIRAEILGFQDELILFKESTEVMNEVVRSRMSGMLQEPYGINPGGNNVTGCTDSGYALDSAATRLVQQQAKQRVIVMLTDGIPEPSKKHNAKKWELKTVVRRLMKGGEVCVVGGGVGFGTEFVKEHFSKAFTETDMQKIPEKLADLFEDIIHNPHTYLYD